MDYFQVIQPQIQILEAGDQSLALPLLLLRLNSFRRLYLYFLYFPLRELSLSFHTSKYFCIDGSIVLTKDSITYLSVLRKFLGLAGICVNNADKLMPKPTMILRYI